MATDYFPTQIDAQRVKKFVRAGVLPEKIALILRITLSQLQQHYSLELGLTDEEDLAEVADVAFKMATSGEDSKMTQWWLEKKGGYAFNSTPAPTQLSKPMTVLLETDYDEDGAIDAEFEPVDE